MSPRRSLLQAEDDAAASPSPSAGATTPLEEALGITRRGTCVRHPSCPVLANHTVLSCRVCFSEEKSVGFHQSRNYAAVVSQLQTMNKKGGGAEAPPPASGEATGAGKDPTTESGAGAASAVGEDSGDHSIALSQPQALESIMKRLEQVQNWMVRQKAKEVMSLQLTIQDLEEKVTAQEVTIQEQKDTIRALRKTIQQDLKIIKTMATQKERELEAEAAAEAASHASGDREPTSFIITSSNVSLLGDVTVQSNEDSEDDDDSMLFESPVRRAASSSPSKPIVSPAGGSAASGLKSPPSLQALGASRSSPRKLPALSLVDPQPIRRGTKKSAYKLAQGDQGSVTRGVRRHASNRSSDASVTIPEERNGDDDDEDDEDEDDDNEKLFVPPQQREYWSDEDLSFARDPVKIFASFRGGLLDIPKSPPPACHNKKKKLKLRVDSQPDAPPAPPNTRRVQRSFSGISDDGLFPLKAMAGNLNMLPSLDHTTASTPQSSVPSTPVSVADSATPSPKAGKSGPAPPAPPLSLLGAALPDSGSAEAQDGAPPGEAATDAPVPGSVRVAAYSVPEIPPFRPREEPVVEPSTCATATGNTNTNTSAIAAATYTVTREKSQDKYGDLGMYTGSLSLANHLPHGKGVMNYESGRVYDGEWLSGHWNGKARLLNPNGDTYEGEFVFDSRHGQGTYKWDNGDVYVGSFTQDKRHGKGRFDFHNGNSYDGDFYDGMFDGYGKYKFAGGYYEGEWKHGRYEGNGELVYATGAKYVGEFRNSVAHGFGTEISADGEKRRGCWDNGQPVEHS
jgi:hypothetical protein